MEIFLSIFTGHLEKMLSVPPHRDENLNLFPFQIRQPLFDQVLFRNTLRKQYLFRDKFSFTIVLMKEGRKDLFIRKPGGWEGKPFASKEFSCPNKERVDNDGMILTMETDHVLVDKITRYNLLFFDHRLDVLDLIPNLSSRLKVESLGFSFHPFL